MSVVRNLVSITESKDIIHSRTSDCTDVVHRKPPFVIKERLLDIFGDAMAILREKDGKDLFSEFLTLPFEAIRELLNSDRLVVDSENTVVVRETYWQNVLLWKRSTGQGWV